MSEICPVCGLPKELCVCEEIAMEEQHIQIYTTRRRFGKLMTIIDGINRKDIDLKDLSTQLKTKCACGGTVKDGRIELQGDQKRRVSDILVRMGYSEDMIDLK
ncbi:MAG: stress response translation initiation inhibitor YciH [Theionarchaea archaeon]|nr:stress response translation initiation inhibitor YciH [Theionarchaea archaeon]